MLSQDKPDPKAAKHTKASKNWQEWSMPTDKRLLRGGRQEPDTGQGQVPRHFRDTSATLGPSVSTSRSELSRNCRGTVAESESCSKGCLCVFSHVFDVFAMVLCDSTCI